jgi:EAL domain-containing protein (putative c-di-GMP-specific phosphodiesterase class I)
MGISISIDDFGTGYSSFAYLRQLPLDRLKIDRAFIKDIPEADDGQIASTVIVLAKTLGLKVLAEGVETEAQLAFLKEHDCDEYQGFYLSRPVLAAHVVEHFSRRTSCAVI